MLRAVLIAFVFPCAAHAEMQPEVAALMHYMDGTTACFDGTQSVAQAQTCIRQGASRCMETEEGGFTTLGMTFCILAETESWDRLLNREYAMAMDALRSMDENDLPGYAIRADSLRAAQRVWITLRDADCGLEYALWGNGSMRHLAGSSCQLQKTAERTVFLRDLAGAM